MDKTIYRRDSYITKMLQISDREFKIGMINMTQAILGRMDNTQKHEEYLKSNGNCK